MNIDIPAINDLLILPPGVWVILLIVLIAVACENLLGRFYNKQTNRLEIGSRGLTLKGVAISKAEMQASNQYWNIDARGKT